MPRLLYHHNRFLARADCCHMWRLLDRVKPTDRRQGSSDGELQFSEEVDMGGGVGGALCDIDESDLACEIRSYGYMAAGEAAR